MKSIRYLLIITWVFLMASLGLFSDIGSLKQLFSRCHFGGDANVPGLAIMESEVGFETDKKAEPLPNTDRKTLSKCKKGWYSCRNKKTKVCGKVKRKSEKKYRCNKSGVSGINLKHKNGT